MTDFKINFEFKPGDCIRVLDDQSPPDIEFVSLEEMARRKVAWEQMKSEPCPLDGHFPIKERCAIEIKEIDGVPIPPRTQYIQLPKSVLDRILKGSTD